MIKEWITKKDIRKIEKKLDVTKSLTKNEVFLLQTADWSEFRIQSYCHNLFNNSGFGDRAIFFQVDNGGSSIEGVRKKKAAAGTKSGFPDVMIIVFNEKNTLNIYIEFKKINGSIKEPQKEWNKFLRSKEQSAYICNNIVFFEEVVLKEIRNFLN